MIAVAPGDKAEVGRYLNELGVVVDGIVNASLGISTSPQRQHWYLWIARAK